MTQNSWNTPSLTTNGEILIGSTGVRPVAATISAGAGITVTNGAGSISISSAGGGGGGPIAIRVFTSDGTYIPTPGMATCIIEAVGGGGAGGGAAATAGNQVMTMSGGGGGEYALGRFTAVDIGVSQAITIGAGGAGVSGAAGNAGGATSVGALISANGGGGGNIQVGTAPADATAIAGAGGTGGAGGSYRVAGQTPMFTAGFIVQGAVRISFAASASGGNSLKGFGGRQDTAGALYGGGGGGGSRPANTGASIGPAGAPGVVIVTEY